MDEVANTTVITKSCMSYLHFSTDETLLFEGWSFSSVGGLLGSCLVFTVFAFVVEALIVLRKQLYQKYAADVRHRLVERENSESTRLIEEQAEGQVPIFSCGHLVLTFLYALQNLIFYLLMLVVMTGNAFFLIAIVLGTTLGYFTFAWRVTITVNVTTYRK